MTALDIPELEGCTPLEATTGSTPNITPYILFNWFENVYYCDPVADFPHQKRRIGKLIAAADNCTDELAYTVLPLSGRPITRKAVWAIPPHELSMDATKADIIELDMMVEQRFGDHTIPKPGGSQPETECVLPIDDLPPPPPDLFEGDEDNPITMAEPNDGL